MPHDSDMTFTLGRNAKGDNPKRPDYRGEMRLGGEIYDLSGWIRTNKTKGTKFLSGRVQKRVPRVPKDDPAGFDAGQEGATAPKAAPTHTFLDD